MRPPEVSVDVILAAGKRLVAEGKPITGWRLRQAVGDRGKPERLLAVWKAELARDEDPAPPADVEPTILPPVVAEEAAQARTALATNFDTVVAKLARTTEDMLKARYREDFERLASERARMDDELKTASESVDATDGALAEALTEVETLRARVAELEREGLVLSERIRALDIAVPVLEEKLRQADEAARSADHGRVAAEATAAAAEREADRLRARLADVEQVGEERLAAARQENGNLREQLSVVERGGAILIERIRSLEVQAPALEARAIEAETAAREARQRLEFAESKAVAAEARVIAAETTTAATAQETARLWHQLEELTRERLTDHRPTNWASRAAS